MNPSPLIARLINLYKLGVIIAGLPRADLRFHAHLDPVHIEQTHRNFTKPHPRYKVFKSKSLGVALINLRKFQTPAEYLDSVKQKGHAGPQSRKALARGYQMHAINRNELIDEIHKINISSEERQGRKMDEAYLTKQLHYEDRDHYRYYGVFNASGTLVAYCNIAIFGSFAATDQLLGLKNNDGAMYLLLMEIICQLIDERTVEYFMYDTLFGAQPGLSDFKRRVGFTAYRARYTIG